MAAAIFLFARLDAGAHYWRDLFPATIVLGLGLCLTATVMSSLPAHSAGIASAINNAASRVAGLLAIAALGIVVTATFSAALSQETQSLALAPEIVARVEAAKANPSARAAPDLPAEAGAAIITAYTAAFRRAMEWSAALAACGGLIAALIIRTAPAHLPVGTPGTAPRAGHLFPASVHARHRGTR